MAAPSLRCVADGLKGELDLDISILELPISVAALMTPEWASSRIASLKKDDEVFRGEHPGIIVMPGRVSGDLKVLEEALGVRAARGPNDLWDLPEWLGLDSSALKSLDAGEPGAAGGARIIAEIVDAGRMPVSAIAELADAFRRDGADYIDLGGSPDIGVPGVEEKIAALRARGFLVSVDTFHKETIHRALEAGADMILSVNSSNMDLLDLAPAHCKVVAVPDYELGEDDCVSSLELNVENASRLGAAVIADPILAPPLMGFVPSLCRFYEYRSLHPDVPMLMGAGNVTELLEADSAGVNALLAACIHELKIDYVLTTEVARWTRGAVRELREARGIMSEASRRGAPPKKISHALRELKGPQARFGLKNLREMQSSVTDPNWRIFATAEAVCAFNRERFLYGSDIKEIYARMEITDPRHGFYLGKELQKAAIALSLGRNYVQDDELTWGAFSERS